MTVMIIKVNLQKLQENRGHFNGNKESVDKYTYLLNYIIESN